VALSKIDTAAIATDAIEAAQLKSDAIAVGDLPTGSIIQVTQGTTFTGNYSNNTNSWTDSTLEVSITPSSSSNKIMVQFSGAIRCYNTSGNDASGAWRIYRKIGSGSYAQLSNHEMTHRAYDYGGSGLINDVPLNIQYLDSPSTTSAVSYKLYGNKMAGSQIELNPDGQDESYAFAMEVVG
jgi:hypothetical protein|tara:strand:+ start:84 stop:626 length:543 start_codon:yes stop_codon:yes gene_type:complete